MRVVEATDMAAIAAAIHQLELNSSRYPFPIKPSLEAAIEHVMQKASEGDAYIGNGVLLLVSTFTPWFSKDKVFQEEFMLSVGSPSLRPVIRFIEQEARRRGCDYILAGNTYQDARLTELYQRLGYQHTTDILMKEL